MNAAKILFFILSVSTFIFLTSCRYSHSPHKSDAEMISVYQKNSGDFKRLIEMAKEDKRDIVLEHHEFKGRDEWKVRYGYQSRVDDVPSKERADEYEKLLRHSRADSVSVTQICPNCKNEKPIKSKSGEIIFPKPEDPALYLVTQISLRTSNNSDGFLGDCFYTEEKGYFWVADDSQYLASNDNLDRLYTQKGDNVSGYRAVGDNWYLYYSHHTCSGGEP